VFLDESSIDGCRYMGVGGLWLSEKCERELRARISAIRLDARMRPEGEFKWQKCSGSKPYKVFTPLVDAFFEAGECRFNAMIIDQHNPGKHRGDDKELDFYKSVYFLVRGRYEADTSYRLVLDRRSDKRRDSLSELERVTNNGIRGRAGIRHAAMRSVEAVDSRKEPLIQLADVLLGAVCYHSNAMHERANASRGKCEIASYIASRAGFRGGTIKETHSKAQKFNVWFWREKPEIQSRPVG
jgi:hypothetical protein